MYRTNAHSKLSARKSGYHRSSISSSKVRVGDQSSRSLQRCQALTRVFTVSDTHFDYKENLEWCERVSNNRDYANDILILAGDACDSLELLEQSLAMLSQAFGIVFYTVGNHELWVRAAESKAGIKDSVTKLERILDLCSRLNIRTLPQRIGNLWIAPLYSWHHSSWDKEPEILGVPAATSLTLADYAACRWPEHVPGGDDLGSIELAKWFDSLNDGPLWTELVASRADCDVLSFSHFLPHQCLIPEKRYLFFPNLTKGVGSDLLAKRIEQLQSSIHVFGHTHFSWDFPYQGVRYIQAPLCSPTERRRRLKTISFDAVLNSMGDTQQHDPEAADWLPIEIYRFDSGQTLLNKLPIDTAGEAQQQHEPSSNYSCLAATQIAENRLRDLIKQPLDNANINSTSPSSQDKTSKQVDEEEIVRLCESMHLPKRQRSVHEEADSEPESELDGDECSDSEAEEDDDEDDDIVRNNNNGRVALDKEEDRYEEEETGEEDVDDPLSLECNGGTALCTTNTETSLYSGVVRYGTACENLGAHWSEYYKRHERTPEELELASWVAEFYKKRYQRRHKKIKAHAATNTN